MILFSGGLRLQIYYNAFHIPIFDYIEVSEIFTHVLRDFLLLVVLICSISPPFIAFISVRPTTIYEFFDDRNFEPNTNKRTIKKYWPPVLFSLIYSAISFYFLYKIIPNADDVIPIFIILIPLLFVSLGYSFYFNNKEYNEFVEGKGLEKLKTPEELEMFESFKGKTIKLSPFYKYLDEQYRKIFSDGRLLYLILLIVFFMLNFCNIFNNMLAVYRIKSDIDYRKTGVIIGERKIKPFDKNEYYVGQTSKYVFIFNDSTQVSESIPYNDNAQIYFAEEKEHSIFFW